MPQPSFDSPIDTTLLRAIYGCARECKVSNEELHEAIAQWKKKSLKDISRRQAHMLLDGMRKVAGLQGHHRREAQASHGRKNVQVNVHYQPSHRERLVLLACAELRGWDQAALDQFILRQLHREILTLADYNKILWGLKAMNRRDMLHS